MNKKILKYFVGIVIVVGTIIAVFMSCRQLDKKRWKSLQKVYKEYVEHDWIQLEYYEANKGTHLGKRPDKDLKTTIFSGHVYNLKGIPENQLLYCEENDLYGGEKLIEILLNVECEEPIKSMPIKKIEITLEDKSKITISDKETLNSIQQLFREGPRTEVTFYYTFNAKVYFDTKCNLTYTCGIFEREDGSIVLAYYDNEPIIGPYEKYCYYDVTELLKDQL